MIHKYIELTNNKKIPKNKKSWDNLYDSYENLNSAGLILDDKTVVVDFDTNPHVAEYILKAIPTRAVKTKRGYHLYYKIPDDIKITNNSKVITIGGFPVDYKTGANNKKAYAIVKLNGVERPVINEDITEYPFLPKFLYPTKGKVDLLSVKKGSRNSELFKHFCIIKDYFNNKDDFFSISISINKLLEEPLPENELLKTADSAYNRPSNKKLTKKEDLLYKIQEIKNKLLITIYNEKVYFKRENGTFSCNQRELLHEIYKRLNFTFSKTEDYEILHQLQKTDNVISENSNINIVLRNNQHLIYDKVEISDGSFSPYFLNVKYDDSAYDKHVDDFLNWFCCDDIELRQLIEEIIGHILLINNKPQHAFFLVNYKGANGKSTFLEMLNSFCGNLSSNLGFSEFKTEYIGQMRDKLLNVADDVNSDYIDKSQIFKTLVSGNTIISKELYENPKPFKNKATLIFSCNEMPKFKDKSGGIIRRIRLIPCYAEIKKIDLNLIDKLSTDNAKSYILNLGIRAITRLKNNNFIMTNPKKCQELTNDYITENDNMKLFLMYLKEHGIITNDTEYIDTNTAYINYLLFCDSENLKNEYSKTKFSQKVKQTFDWKIQLKKINKKVSRYYILK